MDKKGVGENQDFPSKFFCLTVPKIFVGEPFSVSIISGIEKIYASEGYVTIFCRKIFVSQYRNISQRSFLCCVSENVRQRKSFRIRRRWKYQDFPSKLFSSHSVEKCRRGFLQSFTNFGYGESLEEKVRGGGYQDSPLEVSCLTVTEIYVGQPFRVSLISVIENFYAPESYVTFFCRNFLSDTDKKIRRGTLLRCVSGNFRQQKNLFKRRDGISRFSVETFLSDSAENFRGGIFQCVINFGYRRLLCFRRLCHDFLSEIFRLTVPKKQKGKPSMLCFRKFPLAKKIIDRKEGKYQVFPSKFFLSHSVEKCRRGFLQSFNNFGYGEILEEKVRGESIKIFR